MLLPIARRSLVVRSTAHNLQILLRSVHSSPSNRQHHNPPKTVSHGVENYFVDGDESPPPNDSIFKVDANSDAAESAYEAPSGPWSRAGTETAEYRTVSKDEPHDLASEADDSEKLRYGGKKRYFEDDNLEMGKAKEGPEGNGRWGRKPEGRA